MPQSISKSHYQNAGGSFGKLQPRIAFHLSFTASPSISARNKEQEKKIILKDAALASHVMMSIIRIFAPHLG